MKYKVRFTVTWIKAEGVPPGPEENCLVFVKWRKGLFQHGHSPKVVQQQQGQGAVVWANDVWCKVRTWLKWKVGSRPYERNVMTLTLKRSKPLQSDGLKSFFKRIFKKPETIGKGYLELHELFTDVETIVPVEMKVDQNKRRNQLQQQQQHPLEHQSRKTILWVSVVSHTLRFG